MISIMSLWLPILLSAVFVFVVSSLIHMVFKYHQNDFSKLPDEEKTLEGLRSVNLPPGDYMFPYCSGPKEMGSPELIEKMNQGPVGIMTVMKNGPISMTKSLVLWFLYSILVSILAAYIAGRALAPGAHYLEVFRFVGCTAFIGYSLALLQNSIWYSRDWCSTIKSMSDGLVYALVTAGCFGWLWPR